MLNKHLAARKYRLDFETFFNGGPTDWIPFEEIEKIALRGEIKEKTLVWKEGLKYWVERRRETS